MSVKFMGSSAVSVQFGVSKEVSHIWTEIVTLPFGPHLCVCLCESYLAVASEGTIWAEGLSVGSTGVLIVSDGAGVSELTRGG